MKILFITFFFALGLSCNSSAAENVTIECSGQKLKLKTTVPLNEKTLETVEAQLISTDKVKSITLTLFKVLVLPAGEYYKDADTIVVQAYSLENSLALWVSAILKKDGTLYPKNEFRSQNALIGPCTLEVTE